MKQLFFICCVLLFVSGLPAQPRLSFLDGKFTIVQFTDLHWDPRSSGCDTTAATIRGVLDMEHPDLAVLSGDIVTGDPALRGWNQVISLFEESHTPFVVTMGNHDGEYSSKDTIFDTLLRSPYYAGSKGPSTLSGCGNCVLPLFSSSGGEKPVAALYCIDSNDYQPNSLYGAYDWIHFNQIDWFRQQRDSLIQVNGGHSLPSLLFMHIPLKEYESLDMVNATFGNSLEGCVSSADVNSGMFASLVETPDVMGVFAGHDHDNDYIGMNGSIALGYGRVTGADAYGSLTRGARIISLTEGAFRFDTWITTPEGREPAYYYPSGLNEYEELSSTYLPALNQKPLKHGVAYSYHEGNFRQVADIDKVPLKKKGIMNNLSILDAPVSDHFAYKFHTLLNIAERGVYRFYMYSDDGAVLYIDGHLVIDNDGGHSKHRAEGKVALEAGLHDVRVLYFEDYMGETLEVGYSGRNLLERPLPDECLFLPD